MLDFVDTVTNNIGANERGNVKVCTYYKIISDILTLDRMKASQLALCRGRIISKIM